jgi:cyclophilin family peptidyl-prolyl cis-trans isomerase
MNARSALSLCALLAAASTLHAQNAATGAAESKGSDAAARALEMLGNKAKGLEEALDKVSPSLLKEAEKAPSALKPAVDAVKSVVGGAKSGAAAKPKAPKSDPASWSKDSQRKLAVMDVEFGGGVQTIMFELFEKDTPATVGNFIENCESKSYDGLAVHRAIDGYLVQTGDPLTADDSQRSSWGTGGGDKTIPAELKRDHTSGCVAMARRSDKVNPKRESNGYQFYFGLGNMGALDGSYTVFGQVVSGLEVLKQISQAPADSNDCPLQRIEVKSVRVIDHKGPLINMRSTGFGGVASNGGRRTYTKPTSAKSGWERMLERIW